MSSTEIFAVIIASASVISAVASAFFSFNQSRRSMKNDIINDYEKRMQQLEAEMKLANKKLLEIKTMLDKREGELKTVTEVLQGKNPETIIFMDTLTRSAHSADSFMRRTTIMIEALMSHSSLPIPPIQHDN